MISKVDIRKELIETKSKLSLSQVGKNSSIIINKLRLLDEYIQSKTIFTYVSFNQEVITKDLIEGAIKNKKVAVPKIEYDRMNFYYINSFDDLEIGVKGILEPADLSKSNMVIPTNGDLFVVPGLAFDNNLNRIGYGKGYYDAYFKEYSHVTIHKIALTHELQIVDQIPTDDYDVKVDRIITESRIIS